MIYILGRSSIADGSTYFIDGGDIPEDEVVEVLTVKPSDFEDTYEVLGFVDAVRWRDVKGWEKAASLWRHLLDQLQMYAIRLRFADEERNAWDDQFPARIAWTKVEAARLRAFFVKHGMRGLLKDGDEDLEAANAL